AQQRVLFVALDRSVPSLAANAAVQVPPDGPAHLGLLSRRRLETVCTGLTITHVARLLAMARGCELATSVMKGDATLGRQRPIGRCRRWPIGGVAPGFRNLLSRGSNPSGARPVSRGAKSAATTIDIRGLRR